MWVIFVIGKSLIPEGHMNDYIKRYTGGKEEEIISDIFGTIYLI